MQVQELRIVPVEYGHPDAMRLIEEVQAEYVVRYGSRDETPLDRLMFVPPAGSFFVGYRGDDAVATGAWRSSGVPALGTDRTAEIKRMYVVPRAQRAGYARRMLGHLESSARDAGFAALILETGDKQPEALRLYTSAGYEPIPSFGHYRDSPENRCFGRLL